MKTNTSTNFVLTNESLENWFKTTNYQIFEYQIEGIIKINNSLNGLLIPVLAACPSAGKTLMSIVYTYFYIKNNPKAKVLVFTHGIKQLREQYFNVLEDLIETGFKEEKDKVDFMTFVSHITLVSSSDYKTTLNRLSEELNDESEFLRKSKRIIASNKDIDFKKILKSNNVVVTLPHTVYSALNQIQKNMFDLVIVDEAHHYYLAGKNKDTGMMKKLIKQISPKHQLLLTGTPSCFIRENHINNAKNLNGLYDIIPITVYDLMKYGRISKDMIIEVARSKYDFNTDDFNTDGELKKEKATNLKKIETDSTLDQVLNLIIKRLNSEYKDDPIKYYDRYYKGTSKLDGFAKGLKLTKDLVLRKKTWNEVVKDWNGVLNYLKKTIIACKSQAQAEQVKKFLCEKLNGSHKIALSISDNDKNESESTEINKFINNDDCLILIVVRRAVLGFNLPELVNVVDMSLSQNPDVIFQLFGRVLRPHPDGNTKKLFIKIAPSELATWYTQLMVFVLSLCHETFFTNFNGKNLFEMKVLGGSRILNDTIPPINPTPPDINPEPTFIAPSIPDYSELFSLIPNALEFFHSIYMKSNDLLTGEAYITMGEAYDRLFSHLSTRITREKFIELSLAHPKNRQRFEERKERLIENARQFKDVESWKKEYPYAYQTAINENWLDDCTKHMK